MDRPQGKGPSPILAEGRLDALAVSTASQHMPEIQTYLDEAKALLDARTLNFGWFGNSVRSRSIGKKGRECVEASIHLHSVVWYAKLLVRRLHCGGTTQPSGLVGEREGIFMCSEHRPSTGVSESKNSVGGVIGRTEGLGTRRKMGSGTVYHHC